MTKHADPVSLFLDAVASGTGVPTALYADDVLLDATTPGWRFTQHGPDRVAGQLSAWFADPAALSELRRERVATGEVVSFTLSWLEDGEPWAAHQVHVIDTRDGRITRQEAWCGGRWDAQRQHAIADAMAVAR